MAENCGLVCIKDEIIRQLRKDVDKGETSTKEILKVVSDIKEGYSDTKYSLLSIKDKQETQATRDKENKDLFMSQFNEIKASTAAEKLKLEKEKEDAAKAKVLSDEDDKKEKRKTRNAIYVAVAVVVANTMIGLYIRSH